jgi:hypothetical protein
MENFTFNLRPADGLFDKETFAAMAKGLAPAHRATDGRIVAIRMRYLDVRPDPVRSAPPLFLVRDDDAFKEQDYSELSSFDRARIADALMWLEHDETFHEAVVNALAGRTDQGCSHELLITANSVAFFRLDVAYCNFRGWSSAAMDQFCRILCLKAGSLREALAREEELAWQSRLWKRFVASLPVPEPACAVPVLKTPSVADLVVPATST